MYTQSRLHVQDTYIICNKNYEIVILRYDNKVFFVAFSNSTDCIKIMMNKKQLKKIKIYMNLDTIEG